MSSRFLFSSICARGVSSEQSVRQVRSRERQSAISLAGNVAVISRANISPALANVVLLNIIPAARFECGPTSHLVQVSEETAIYSNFLGPSGSSANQSLSMLSNDTKKKLAESMEELEDVEDERKVFFVNIRVLKAKNWSLWAVRYGLEPVVEGRKCGRTIEQKGNGERIFQYWCSTSQTCVTGVFGPSKGVW